MISFKPVDFNPEEIPGFDWVFFSSPQTVREFLKSYPNDLLTAKIAVLGEGTRLALEKAGFKADFHPKSSRPEEVGVEFRDYIKDQVVLFPQSDISRQSVQKQLEFQQVINLVVYRTIPLPSIDIRQEDVLIFTSPSNAQAYLSRYPLTETQKTLAMGETTASELRKYCNPDRIFVSETPSEEGIWEALLRLS